MNQTPTYDDRTPFGVLLLVCLLGLASVAVLTGEADHAWYWSAALTLAGVLFLSGIAAAAIGLASLWLPD